MNEKCGGKETYMTVEEVAEYLKLANQTIRKFVLKKTIPYRKVQKSVRFRLSEIEKWVDQGGGNCRDFPVDVREGDLFADLGDGETAGAGQAGADSETGEAQV
jgi:excisionase family DNA binding protein